MPILLKVDTRVIGRLTSIEITSRRKVLPVKYKLITVEDTMEQKFKPETLGPGEKVVFNIAPMPASTAIKIVVDGSLLGYRWFRQFEKTITLPPVPVRPIPLVPPVPPIIPEIPAPPPVRIRP